jgi:cation diffusion facilitator family transporter
VVGGALGAAAGWELADPLVGLLIALGILLILRRAARDVFRRVMDGVDPSLIEEVHHVAAQVDGVEAVEVVRLRWVGHELISEIEVVSDCDVSLARAHAIAEEAHHRLLHEIPRLARVTIHTSPCDHDGRLHHEVTAHHFLRSDEGVGA